MNRTIMISIEESSVSSFCKSYTLSEA